VAGGLWPGELWPGDLWPSSGFTAVLDGQTPSVRPILASSREQSWAYEVWDRTTGYTGKRLSGVKGGNLAWQKNQAIKGQGSLDVVQSSDGSLLNALIRPVLTIKGWGTQPYGLWVPSFPKRSFASSSWTGSVDLVSLEAILSYTSAASVINDSTDITVTIPAGTVVTDWINAALRKAGLTRFIVQASTQTETAPQSWSNGETLLQVINAELQRIGYSSLYSDMSGTLRADPYVLPEDRAESFSALRPFDVNGNPIFLTAFDLTDNAPNVPNQVRAVGTPVGWLPGQTAVSVNNDPTSPYSVGNRGYVIEKVYTDVNALSQDAVQSYAHQQLLNLSKDGRKAEVKFPHLPGAALNQVFHFNTPRAGAPMFSTMDALGVDLAPKGLSSATLTAVTAVQDETVA